MKIELHLLQNFAPSNLNRDDTGAPKDCELGGHRRARISSQCQKRAVRQAFVLSGLLPEENRGARTKRLAHQIAEVLQGSGIAREQGLELAITALKGVGLGLAKKGAGDDAYKTEYLLFVPRGAVGQLAEVILQHRAALEGLSEATPEPSGEPAPTAKKKTKKDEKKAAQAAFPKEAQKQVETILESARSTADVALFGRMIADKPAWGVDAACQVAQAVSTNRVQMDFDFFTAVDDFKPGDTAGSDMMGTVQFNSSCFYRYAVLDVGALERNLDVPGDEGKALLRATVDAFVRGFVTAIPTGKQASMAANNFPSYALAVVREKGQPISLTNAFLKPARPRGEDKDLVDVSVEALESYYARLADAVGKTSLAVCWADRDLDPKASIDREPKLSTFYERITAKAVAS